MNHADLRPQLDAWVFEVKEAMWKTSADVKSRFPTASFLKDNIVVFNLKGNKYRLDIKIDYGNQVLLVRRIGTHAEYSKWEF
jgi:mRNA interferase HigB